MVFWEGYVSDELMGTLAPIALYWLYGGAYMLMPPLKRHLLHSKREDKKNIIGIPAVIKGVLFQQLLQVIVVRLIFLIAPGSKQSEPEPQPPIFVQLLQILIIAIFVMDTWQYFVHRYLHTNTFLYRRIHSYHHRLVVLYAIGALYNHPLEGLLVDTLGGAVSFLVSGMTARTGVYFFSIAVMKTVDDLLALATRERHI